MKSFTYTYKDTGVMVMANTSSCFTYILVPLIEQTHFLNVTICIHMYIRENETPMRLFSSVQKEKVEHTEVCVYNMNQLAST